MTQAATTRSNAADRAPMARLDLTKRLVSLAGDAAIVAGIGNTNFDLYWAGPRPQNFYMLGSMGLACPIALGVAIAQPNRQVIALEGDGSLLMNLGSLATIAWRQPPNLTVVVWDNGAYQITGHQPAASSAHADVVAMARGAGIEQARWAQNEADFERLVRQALESDGPTLIGARIDSTGAPAIPERDAIIIRDRFERGIGTKKDILG